MVCVDMKEHKIEILCQMEDERDSPVEHCNAGPGPQEPFINTSASDMASLQRGIQLSGGIGNLLAGLGGGIYGSLSKRCHHCGR